MLDSVLLFPTADAVPELFKNRLKVRDDGGGGIERPGRSDQYNEPRAVTQSGRASNAINRIETVTFASVHFARNARSSRDEFRARTSCVFGTAVPFTNTAPHGYELSDGTFKR